MYLPVADTNSAMAKHVAQNLQQAVTSGDKIYETDAYKMCIRDRCRSLSGAAWTGSWRRKRRGKRLPTRRKRFGG